MDVMNMPGRIVAIYVAASFEEPQRSVDRVELVAGAGIVGDRYYNEHPAERGLNLTLIEAEEIERFNATHGASAPLHATRRNVVTRGVRLNDLVGREFLIGNVRARGVELCEPCRILGANLATPTVDVAAVVRAFVHRAGLRADLLSSGPVRVGDRVAAALAGNADLPD
jgi:MOSC domain-containing protein YiiM